MLRSTQIRAMIMKKKLLIGLLLYCSISCWAGWGAEWLYCRTGAKLDYSYANVLGEEKYPLGFQASAIIELSDLFESDFEDYLAVSIGENFGGNWKNTLFTYTKDNYDNSSSIASEYYSDIASFTASYKENAKKVKKVAF